ncbi:MAG: adenylate/guanylate cyclase domain-containing protein, partial [Elusimicrobiota bacterium]
MEGTNPSPGTEPHPAIELATDGLLPRPRLLPFLRSFLRDRLFRSFEGFFVLLTFSAIALILYFIDQKLSFLNFYFIPILLAGYFMNTRSAVLGSLLSILVVTFFVVVNPDSFYQELTRMGLYLHLVTWGSFLILTGAMVGHLTEKLRSRFLKASDTLSRLADMQETLSKAYKRLEERNLTLEANKTRVEAVLNSTLDPLLARLIIENKVRSETREMTVLRADLVDAGGRARELPPESLVAELNRAFSTLDPVFTRFGGHLDRYSKRGLQVEFGVPYEARQHALLASLAALKMQERLLSLGLPWKLRIGVASGRCLTALVGSENRRNFTVMGQAVDTADRLASRCPLGGVLTDALAFESGGRWFRSRPMRLAQRPRPEGSRGPADSPMGVSVENAADFPLQEAFLLEGLADPLTDPRLPRQAGAAFQELSAKVSLPMETMLPIEAREGTVGHAHAVAGLAAAIAQAMGLEERPVRTVFLSAFLHDIGKRNL